MNLTTDDAVKMDLHGYLFNICHFEGVKRLRNPK